MKRRETSGRAVYSTDPAERAAIERRRQEADRGRATPRGTGPRGASVLRVRLERKGRAGKTVTIVSGFAGDAESVKAIARELKTRCGAGGALKEGIGGREVEVQGDQIARVEAYLRERGLAFRRG